MKLSQNNDKERTRDIRVSQNITFESLLLSSRTLAGLKRSCFYRPSPIQLQGIPLGKCGFDLLLEAKSGTGKTAVFTIIALEKLDVEKGLQAIMLAPTREIAVQICDVIQLLGAGYEGLKIMSVIGGIPVHEDIMKIKKENIHIVVGSPGRLRHLIQDKHLDTSAVRLLVLDEADKLMEKSFLADINYIFSVLPRQKQMIMSSATYPENSKAFIEKYVRNAQHVCPENNSVLLGVKQTLCTVKNNINVMKQTQYRFKELLKILSHKQFKQCLIFCNYQTRVVELKKKLNKEKWPAEHLYGQQEQCDRLDALKMLQEYKCRILVSTDLAARGIDASNVDLVINFEPPLEWQTYLHRIGRAGRFGSYGTAVTIVSEGKEQDSFLSILESLQVPPNYFWEQDKDIETDVTSVLTKQPESSQDNYERHSLKILWDCLSTEPNKNEQKIETFDDLCKSFNAFRVKDKESFTGLMNSFHVHQSELNKTQGKSIGLESVQEKIKILKEFVGFNEKKNYCKSEEKRELNIETEENLKIQKTEVNTSNYPKFEGFSSVYCDEPNFVTEDLTTSLANAGLPTSFGQQKQKFRNSVPSKKKKQIWVPRNQINYESMEEHKSTKQPKKSFSENTNDTSNSSSSDSGFKNSTDYLNSSKIDNTIENPSNAQLQCIYISWYNELKQRVREIEYAVYINEMSSLKYVDAP